MIFYEFELKGNCQVDFDTEIKYNIASAKVNSADLIRLSIEKRESDRENDRLACCILKVLRSMRKEGTIQFFVNHLGFKNKTTESAYLLNKYPEIALEGTASVFVKI